MNTVSIIQTQYLQGAYNRTQKNIVKMIDGKIPNPEDISLLISGVLGELENAQYGYSQALLSILARTLVKSVRNLVIKMEEQVRIGHDKGSDIIDYSRVNSVSNVYFYRSEFKSMEV
jgi:hypothetical protein